MHSFGQVERGLALPAAQDPHAAEAEKFASVRQHDSL